MGGDAAAPAIDLGARPGPERGRYLGDLARLSHCRECDRRLQAAATALDAALAAAERPAPLRTPAPTTEQIDRVLSFLRAFVAPDPGGPRDRRARAAVIATLEGLAAASRNYDDASIEIDALASLIKRSIEDQTFASDEDLGEGEALQIVDDLAARYDDFDDMTIVGLIEADWPERPLRNIFYSSTLLRPWAGHQDWRARMPISSIC